METRLLTLTDVQELTGWSKSHLYRLHQDGKLPAYRPTGGKLFFKQEELETFIFNNEEQSKSGITA
jgi:excisionase family DNA binding protein